MQLQKRTKIRRNLHVLCDQPLEPLSVMGEMTFVRINFRASEEADYYVAMNYQEALQLGERLFAIARRGLMRSREAVEPQEENQ
jgi:hypothetical protein